MDETITTFYQLTGNYRRPYYYSNYLGEDNEIYEYNWYKNNPYQSRILGVYRTENDAKEAKKRFEEYKVIVDKQKNSTTTQHPYKNVQYTKLTIGDHIVLQPIEDSDEE